MRILSATSGLTGPGSLVVYERTPTLSSKKTGERGNDQDGINGTFLRSLLLICR